MKPHARNPDFGTLVIAAKGDHLEAMIGHLKSGLEVYEEDDLPAELIPEQGQVLRFDISGGRRAPWVEISDIRFEGCAEAALAASTAAPGWMGPPRPHFFAIFQPIPPR